jgi:hypothetical protein
MFDEGTKPNADTGVELRGPKIGGVGVKDVFNEIDVATSCSKVLAARSVIFTTSGSGRA